jgi:chorismate dehydratase
LRPRVGHIRFLNCLPLYHGLLQNGVLDDIELTRGTPAELNERLLQDRLDLTAISSIEYSRHQDRLLLLPGLSISCDGDVKSVLFFSRVPLEELDGRPVALTSQSATSQVLLRIILHDRYGVEPRFFVRPPAWGSVFREADAVLLIGDSALKAAAEPRRDLFVYDLGREWLQLTGQKMVFAVWALRREFAGENPDLARELGRRFREAMAFSVAHVAEIAADASRQEPFSAEFLRDYYTKNLEFAFTEKHQAGLLEYYRRASVLGFGPAVRRLEFLEG